MSIASRLERLESRGGGAECPECGGGGNGPVVFRLGEPLQWGETFQQEYCDQCGRQTNFTLELGERRDYETDA